MSIKYDEQLLLIDDDLHSLERLENYLKPLGYKIYKAQSASEALKQMNVVLPSVILLDIQIPDMDGFYLCEQLRKNPLTKDVPIVLINELTSADDRLTALKLGVFDWVAFPFEAEELVLRVNRYVLIRKRLNQYKKALEQTGKAQANLFQSEKLASLGVLTAGIAHEINNPINFVSVGVSGIELDLSDLFELLSAYEVANDKLKLDQKSRTLTLIKQRVDYKVLRRNLELTLNDVKNGVMRTAEIIEGLKRFSRLDNDSLHEIDLHEELDSVVKVIKNITRKKIKFTLKLDNSVGKLLSFPGHLNQLFMNLIVNAEQAVSSPGKIDISTRNVGKGTTISISDDGCGIPEEIGERIFDPFLTTKEIGVGTGLGLSICFGIAQNHNGTITYSSEVGKGTTFTVYLPKQ